MHHRILGLANSIQVMLGQLAIVNSAAQKAILRRQIEAADRQVDQLVYQLYGLTADEVALIEGREQPRSAG